MKRLLLSLAGAGVLLASSTVIGPDIGGGGGSGGGGRATLLDFSSISTTTASVLLSGATGYDYWVLEINDYHPVDDDTQIALRIESGGSVQSGAGTYDRAYGGSITLGADTGTACLPAGAQGVGSLAAESAESHCRIADPDDTVRHKPINCNNVFQNASGEAEYAWSACAWEGGTGALTGIQILGGSGFDRLTAKLWGVKNP